MLDELQEAQFWIIERMSCRRRIGVPMYGVSGLLQRAGVVQASAIELQLASDPMAIMALRPPAPFNLIRIVEAKPRNEPTAVLPDVQAPPHS